MTVNNTYLEVIYDQATRPFTDYPRLLTQYLVNRYSLKPGIKLLDVGCGRGEFLNGFCLQGINGFGLDGCQDAKTYFPDLQLSLCNIELDNWPIESGTVDAIFSKSVIEHYYDPKRFMDEAMRVLKPGGILITMCPAWEYNFRNYFEDYSHRSPFMRVALEDLLKISGYEMVNCEYFRQLPITWTRGIGFTALLASKITGRVAPSSLKRFSKWVRFSKEVMLLSSAKKPGN